MPDTVQLSDKSQYLTVSDALSTPAASPWLAGVRRAGAARFSGMEYPSRRQEDWRFTNIAPILTTAFRVVNAPEAPGVTAADLAPVLFGEAGWTELVFVNGHYAVGLSTLGTLPAGAVAGSLAAALAEGSAVAEHVLSERRESGNVFNALNTALVQDGALVHLPKNAVASAPIHLVHVSVGGDVAPLIHPRNVIVLDSGAQASFIESYVSLDAGAKFCNGLTDIVLGAGAQVQWHKVVEECDAAYHLGTTRVTQDRDSVFRSFAITLGGGIVRNDLAVTLDGEGAEASLNGLYLTGGEQLVDNAVSIEHAKPRGTSWVCYKGVLDGASNAVFSGGIRVRRNAQKTNSKQLNQNLLLSDRATINTKPLLEIFADDVKCTHGATVGQHPKEVIFYFRSRGMNEAMARAMLTYGFADEVINQIEVAPLRKRLDRTVYRRYSPI